MKTVKKLFVVLYHIISYAIIAAAVLLGALYLFGIRPYVVKTGSMEPEIKTGSICFVNTNVTFTDIKTGDIIAFRVGEMLVTHRVVDIDGDGATTRGDANNTDDASKVTKDSLIGRTVFWLPYLGRIPLYARSYDGKIVLIGALALFVILGLLYDIAAARTRSQQEKNENNEAAQNTGSDKDKSGSGSASP